jgi:MoaA/NifB/PqqE/SkfB family radical SAM enzyme
MTRIESGIADGAPLHYWGLDKPSTEPVSEDPVSVKAMVPETPPSLPSKFSYEPMPFLVERLHHHAIIDIIDKCNLLCPTCVRGVQMQKNTNEIMPLQLFSAIVEKVRVEGYPNIALFNWTDPFLCRNLHDYVAIVKKAGLNCLLSSNFSFRPKDFSASIIAALAAGADVLWVTVSGFTQEVYEINHVAGRIDWVKANLEAVADQLRAGTIKTDVRLRCLDFPYNQHEIGLCAEYARRIGIGFEIMHGNGNPFDRDTTKGEGYRQHLEDQLRNFRVTPSGGASAADSVDERVHGKICELLADRIAIDSKGNVFQCCAYPNIDQFLIGPYLDLTEGELLLRRYTHPICASCGYTRRKATATDCERLSRALYARLGFEGSATGPQVGSQ